jgi:hypothetical protein
MKEEQRVTAVHLVAHQSKFDITLSAIVAETRNKPPPINPKPCLSRVWKRCAIGEATGTVKLGPSLRSPLEGLVAGLSTDKGDLAFAKMPPS